jgi:hypothetical protein
MSRWGGEGTGNVANDIVVKTPGGMPVTDTEITQAVRPTLEWDARRRQRGRE